MKKNRYVIKAAAAACTIFVLTAGSCWNKKPASTTIKLKAEDDSALAALAMAAGSNNDNQGTAEWDGDGTSPDENKQLINAVCEAIEYGDEDKLKELVDKAPHLFYENVNIDGIETTPIHLIYGKPMSTIAEELLLNKGAGKQSVEQTKNLLNGNKKSPFDVLPSIGNLLKAGESTIDILMLQVVKNSLTGDEKIFRKGNETNPSKSLNDLLKEAITKLEEETEGTKITAQKDLINRLKKVCKEPDLVAMLAKVEKEAEKKAKKEKERQDKEEKELKAKKEKELKDKKEAEQQEKELKAKKEKELKDKEEADKKAKKEKELKDKEEADKKAKKEAEQQEKEEKESSSALIKALGSDCFKKMTKNEKKIVSTIQKFLGEEKLEKARQEVEKGLEHEMKSIKLSISDKITGHLSGGKFKEALDLAGRGVSYATIHTKYPKKRRYERIVAYLHFLEKTKKEKCKITHNK